MLNSKFIKIAAILLIVFIITIFFVFFTNSPKSSDNQNNTEETTAGIEKSRLPLNTKTSSNTSQDINQYNPETDIQDKEKNVDLLDNTITKEEQIKNTIEKRLRDWKITKDENLLRGALTLSENADNEAILSAWTSFMSTDSGELLKIIDSSVDAKRTKGNIGLIFEWYIELSGEYEKLSGAKKQQLTNQYNQLK
jgi:hypothetical protein